MPECLAALYAIRLLDAIDNWTFVAGLVIVPLVASAIATVSAASKERMLAQVEDAPDRTPMEWIGIDRPWTADDLATLDLALGTSELELHGPA